MDNLNLITSVESAPSSFSLYLMYRGSSFLLQKDYKVHIPVVEELLQTKYKFAMNYLISPADYKRLALTRYISDDEKLVNMHSAG